MTMAVFVGNGVTYARVEAADAHAASKTHTSHGTSHGFSLTGRSLLTTPSSSPPAPDVWSAAVCDKYDVVRDSDGIRVGVCHVDRRMLAQHGGSMMHAVDVRETPGVGGGEEGSGGARVPRIVHSVGYAREGVVGHACHRRRRTTLIPPSVRVEGRGGRPLRFGVTGGWFDADTSEIRAEVSMYVCGDAATRAITVIPDIDVALMEGGGDTTSAAHFIVHLPSDDSTLYIITTTRALSVAKAPAASFGFGWSSAATHLVGECIELLSSVAVTPEKRDVLAAHENAWARKFLDTNFATVSGPDKAAEDVSDHVTRAFYHVLVVPPLLPTADDDGSLIRAYALVWPVRARSLAKSWAARVLRDYYDVSFRYDPEVVQQAANVVLSTWEAFRSSYPASMSWLRDDAYPTIIAPLLTDVLWNAPLPTALSPSLSPYLSASVMLALQVGAEAGEVARRDGEGLDVRGKSWLRTRDAWAAATEDSFAQASAPPPDVAALRVHACEGRRDILRLRCPRTFSAMPDVDAASSSVADDGTDDHATAMSSVTALGISGRRNAPRVDRAFSILVAHPPPPFRTSDAVDAMVLESSAYLLAFLKGICGVRVTGRLHSSPYGVSLIKEGRTVLPSAVDTVSLRLAVRSGGAGAADPRRGKNDEQHVIRNNARK